MVKVMNDIGIANRGIVKGYRYRSMRVAPKDQGPRFSTGTIGMGSTPIFGLTWWIGQFPMFRQLRAKKLGTKKVESYKSKKAGSKDLTSGREHAHVVHCAIESHPAISSYGPRNNVKELVPEPHT